MRDISLKLQGYFRDLIDELIIIPAYHCIMHEISKKEQWFYFFHESF